MKRLCRLPGLLICLPLLMSAPAAAAGPEAAYAKARQAYYRLLDSPGKQQFRHHWTKVRDLFLAVVEVEPSHPRAAEALYMAGKVSQGLYGVSRLRNDARSAVEYFDRLAGNYPESTLADDALYLAGEILEKTLADPTEAWRRYRRAADGYPGGDMAAKARDRAAALSPYAPPQRRAPDPPPVSTSVSSAAAGGVKSIRCQSHSAFTRVVVELDRDVDYAHRFLEEGLDAGAPPRLFIDFPGVALSPDIPRSLALNDGRVLQVRAGQYSSDVARVVLDLAAPGDYRVFSLTEPSRVVVDIRDGSAAGSAPKDQAQSPSPAPSPAPSGSPPPAGDGIATILDRTPSEPPLKVRIPQADPERRSLRIVVDPGHGGKDPGAVGPSGIKEKDVTLAMAKVVARHLKKAFDCEVIMTRETDTYLALDERTALANRVEADLFLSLHANASPSPAAFGIETYYLNFSKNDQAIEVAARENGTTLKEVGDLELILLDLMANAKINESSRLAAEIQRALVGGLSGQYAKIKDLGVRQGPFYVLLGATMPSVLVEAAFISNRREEDRLTDRRYQERTATAIVQGVEDYLKSIRMFAFDDRRDRH